MSRTQACRYQRVGADNTLPRESSPYPHRNPHPAALTTSLVTRAVVSSVPVSVLTAILTNRNPRAILTASILTPWPSPPCALLVVVQSCHPSPLSSPLPQALTSSASRRAVVSCSPRPSSPEPHRYPTSSAGRRACHPLSSLLTSPPSSPRSGLTTSAGRRVIRPRRYPHGPAPPPETRDGGRPSEPGSLQRGRGLQRL